MLSQQEYKDYCFRFKKVERYLQSKSASQDVVVYNICKLRKYYPERMSSILKQAGFLYIEDNSIYKEIEGCGSDLGLFKDGEFLLRERFIFPVRDMMGNTIAMIGWFPDEKKYITTPSKMFSKSCLFYGMEQLALTGIGKTYFLCEGIFDILSLRSIGVPAICQMGITSGRVKESMYSLFKRLIGVPDNDAQGKEVIENDEWSLPINSSYFRWVGDDCKDIDLLVNSYEINDVRALLKDVVKDKNRVITRRI